MSDTKDSIVRLGDMLIRKNGYNAFSYSDISKELGIKNAAVHYHFPNKTDLGLAIIEHHIQNFETFKKNTAPLDPLKQVLAFVNIYEAIRQEKKVCLVGAMATDWDTVDTAIQSKMQVFTSLILDWLSGVLRNGSLLKDFSFTGTPHAKALMIISNMLAATQLARITGMHNFEIIKAQVIRDLQSA